MGVGSRSARSATASVELIEAGQRLDDERRLLDHHVVAAVGHDEEASVADLPRQLGGLGDGHERVAIAADDQGRGLMRRRSAGRSSGWRATSSAIARQEPLPGTRALDRIVAAARSAAHVRIVAHDPCRVHQAAGHAGPGLALRS